MSTCIFTVTDGTGSGTYTQGSTVWIVAYTPNEGSHFVNWSHVNCSVPSGSSGNAVLTYGYESASATANYALNSYSVKYSADSGGTISGNANQTVLWGQNGSQVTASPNANYHFVQWSDGDTHASRTEISVKSNLSFSASFAPNITYYSLAVVTGANGNGESTGDGSYAAGTQVNIVAAPPTSGYQFVAWTGQTTGIDNVNSASTHIHTQASNATITATYSLSSLIKSISGELLADISEIDDDLKTHAKKVAGVNNNV